MKAKRARGRPRGGSDEIVAAVLRATLDEIRRRGLHALRIEAIAKAAGVAKTSIYRRWPNKAELVLAAWMRWREDNTPAFSETGDLRADLVALIGARVRRMGNSDGRAFTQAIMGLNDDAAIAIAHGLHDTAVAAIIGLVERARRRGEVVASADGGAVGELLLAVVNYRAMMRKAPLPKCDIERAVDIVLGGIRRVRGRRLEKLRSLL